MFNRLVLVGVLGSLALTAGDASAQIFRRRAAATVYVSGSPYYQTATPSTVIPSVDNLSESEQVEAQKMIEAGFFTDEEDFNNYLASTPEQRKAKYEEFKKEAVPPTDEERKEFVTMVKAGFLKPNDLVGYASSLMSKRKKIYEEYKKQGVTVPVTPDELAQFMDMVKPEGGFKLIDYSAFSRMSTAQRKAVYEARTK